MCYRACPTLHLNKLMKRAQQGAMTRCPETRCWQRLPLRQGHLGGLAGGLARVRVAIHEGQHGVVHFHLQSDARRGMGVRGRVTCQRRGGSCGGHRREAELFQSLPVPQHDLAFQQYVPHIGAGGKVGEDRPLRQVLRVLHPQGLPDFQLAFPVERRLLLRASTSGGGGVSNNQCVGSWLLIR